MGPGAEKVKRGTTPEGKIEVTVTWKDGRTGVFREGQGYSAASVEGVVSLFFKMECRLMEVTGVLTCNQLSHSLHARFRFWQA